MAERHATPERYEFKERHDTGVITCQRVADGAPILHVSHDEDGYWQFLCSGDHSDGGPDGGVMACLGCTVAKDPSLNITAGLGWGQEASREGVAAQWRSTQEDARWLRVLGRRWSCPTCGGEHDGLFDLACEKPDPWPGNEEKKPNSETLHTRHFLSEDFCVLDGENFFVRCVLFLPLKGTEGQSFGIGVWSTLSEKNFERYRETFDSGEQGELGPWFGWFSNWLKGYPDTLNLKCQVHPRAGRQRPWIEITAEDHPLASEQREGISFDRLAEILALYGHAPDGDPLHSAIERAQPRGWRWPWTRSR